MSKIVDAICSVLPWEHPAPISQ